MDQKQQVALPRLSVEQLAASKAGMRALREAFESLVESIATSWYPDLLKLTELRQRDGARGGPSQ